MRSSGLFSRGRASTRLSTLSLHDALPISTAQMFGGAAREYQWKYGAKRETFGKISEKARKQDRKSTRLNSSHSQISYAVVGLKKKVLSVLRVDTPDEAFRINNGVKYGLSS